MHVVYGINRCLIILVLLCLSLMLQLLYPYFMNLFLMCICILYMSYDVFCMIVFNRGIFWTVGFSAGSEVVPLWSLVSEGPRKHLSSGRLTLSECLTERQCCREFVCDQIRFCVIRLDGLNSTERSGRLAQCLCLLLLMFFKSLLVFIFLTLLSLLFCLFYWCHFYSFFLCLSDSLSMWR